MRSLLVFGHPKAVRDTLPALLRYKRKNIELHDDAFNLRNVADHYFITRDADFVRSSRPLWQPLLDQLLKAREPKTGLLPREKYCSDIDTPVHSINANANAWRGMRDMAVVL